MYSQGGKGVLQEQDAFRLHISQTIPRSVDGYREGSPNMQATGSFSTRALSSQDLADLSYTSGSLPTPRKHWLSARQQQIYLSVVFFAVGFSAITALAVAIIGWLALDLAAYLLVWPSIVVWLVVGILYPDYGKLALKGFAIGVLACLFYDFMRFATIALGLWGDFIPKIGMLLFHTNEPDWVIGYIWRYVGDGGFMGMAFVVCYCLLKPKMDVRIAALAFGLAIWVCLIGTILFAPGILFPLTPITFSLSLLGHVIYGLSIGYLYPVFIRKDMVTWQILASPSIRLAPGMSQTAKKDALAPQSRLEPDFVIGTNSLRRGSTGQFMKPGFIDPRYKGAANLDAIALSKRVQEGSRTDHLEAWFR